MSGFTSLWCNDDDFIHKLKARDATAWSILYDNYCQELRAGISASLNKRALPEAYLDELEQKTWEVSIAKIDTFADTSEPCKIIHWMRVISYNLVQELVYDRKRQTRIELFSDMLEEQIESKTPILSHDEPNDQNPENRLVLDESESQREEYYKLMQKALDELLPEHKEIIWEWAIGASVDDLAFKYKRTRSSVYKVIDRSKAKIKGYITRNFNGR